MAKDEFPEPLPSQQADSGLANASASRRDFLKYLGFSTAAAMAAASCETPVRKAIPYVNRPADLIPGVADYYATTYVSGGEAIPVIAKVRDGRPIKIEGNTLSSFTKELPPPVYRLPYWTCMTQPGSNIPWPTALPLTMQRSTK
ncbi:TAT-variant-translocated molybdopterin oxidoreductase [Paraflavitalea speifideaquila]|uniref:TAT-variant-translocated molybdopterin oxidoreductase n=1 Tax=Paraflavitalea speifideaquila TaxID=3076558 RepID=UPI0028EBFC0B|nr:TAT-variant-translocated molybdopterin oxidoreductase [Paraflavitalea speifideiaquila]